MYAVFRSYFDIVLLRRGPEDLPVSSLLLAFSVSLWVLTFALAYAAFDWLDGRRLVIAVAVSLLAIGAYQILLLIFGRAARTLQTQSALIGCGSLISFAYILLLVIGARLGGEMAIVFGVLAQLASFWSVPVKGHIIGRALDIHWYVGIAIAGGVFILQYLVTKSLTTTQ